MKQILLQRWQSAKVRFAALEPRERLAVSGLGVFFAGLFFVYGLWLPANHYYEDQLEDRDRQFELLQYMRSTEQEARTLGVDAGRLPSGQDLLTEVSKSAQNFQIKPNRLQPEGDSGVSVWFDEVSFNDLISWLQAQSEQGIKIRQLSIDRQDVSGLVDARVVLRGA